MAQRKCDSCGKSYVAKRANSRYCGATCRKRGQRSGSVKNAGKPKAGKVPESLDQLGEMLGADFVGSIRAELEAAGRLESSLGQQALLLARKLGTPMDTGSSSASLSRELRAVMAEALRGVAGVADPLDELGALRVRKLAAG